MGIQETEGVGFLLHEDVMIVLRFMFKTCTRCLHNLDL